MFLLAQVAARDRRGRCVSEYAPPASKAAEALAAHLAVLQAASDANQVSCLTCCLYESARMSKLCSYVHSEYGVPSTHYADVQISLPGC